MVHDERRRSSLVAASLVVVLASPTAGCGDTCDSVRSDLHHCGTSFTVLDDASPETCDCADECIADATCDEIRSHDGVNPYADCIQECAPDAL